MSHISQSPSDDGCGRLDVLATALFVGGLGCMGYGTYAHVSVVRLLRTQHCDGCAPWHPLFVVAPFGIGFVLLLLAGALISRRS